MLRTIHLYFVLSAFLCLLVKQSYAQQGADSISIVRSSNEEVVALKLKNDSVYSALLASLTAHQDSLQRFKFVLNKDSIKTDSLKNWYHQQQASIVSLSLSQKEKKQQLDSLKISFDKRNALLKEEQQKHLTSINEKQTKMNAQLSKWKEKWNALLHPLDSLNAGGTEVSSLGDASGNNTNSFSGDRSLNVPDLSIPSTELPSLEAGQLSLPHDVEVPDVAAPEMPSLESLQQNLAIPEVQQIQEKFKQIEALETTISHYKKDLDSLDREKVVKKVETIATEQAKKLEEVNAIEKSKGMSDAEMQKIQQYESMMRQYQDKEYIAQQMEQKSKQVANNLLKEKAPQLQEAQKQLTASQKKYKKFSSLSDAKKHWNSLKGSPFNERFSPGLTLQFQKSDYQEIFLSLGGVYRLSGRFAIGLTGTYRAQIKTKPHVDWITSMDTFGPRLIGRVGIAKGFFFHVEWENLSSAYYNKTTKESEPREWTDRVMAGLGKSFNVSKRFKGETLLLYNLYHKRDYVYNTQINLRTGFYFRLKK